MEALSILVFSEFSQSRG